MRLVGILLALASLPTLGDGLSGSVSVTHNHHYQGFRQNAQSASIHGNGQVELGDFSAGVWIGRYELPRGFRTTNEIDYFVSFQHELGFRHRLETSLWHYTYTDDDVSDYDWSQWLSRYHYDTWLTVTVGLADNLLRADRPAVLAEALVRRPLTTHASTSLAIGRNRFSEYTIDSFSYATLKASYNRGRWHATIDYTATTGTDSPTRMWVHDGISFGLTYAFD